MMRECLSWQTETPNDVGAYSHFISYALLCQSDRQYLSSIEASVSACLVSGEEPYKEVASDNKMTDALVGNRFESPSIAPCTKQQGGLRLIYATALLNPLNHARHHR